MELMVTNAHFGDLSWPRFSFEPIFDDLADTLTETATMLTNFTLPDAEEAMPVDIVEYDSGYYMYCEAPGMDPNSLDLKIQNGWLVVEAERKQPSLPEHARFLLAERSYGHIRRSFRLPEDVDTSQVSARYKDGVLEIHLAKAQDKRPQRIQITYMN